MEKIILISTREELLDTIREALRESTDKKSVDFDISEKKNRREAAGFLGISYQTACNWTRSGLIKEHGQGRKKFYLRSELIKAMENNG
jgi:hypothetical protein